MPGCELGASKQEEVMIEQLSPVCFNKVVTLVHKRTGVTTACIHCDCRCDDVELPSGSSTSSSVAVEPDP
jgi:hypothetical protein